MLAAFAWIGRTGIPVLTYHSVTAHGEWLPWSDEITVHPDSLKAQLAMLNRIGMRSLSTRGMIDRRIAGQEPDKQSVVLHFDDGYRDNLVVAADIVRNAGMTATCFVSLDFVEPGETTMDGSHDGDLAGYLNWAEIRALRDDYGWEIEPHGLDHCRVATSNRAVGVLTEDNWKQHAWLQWRHTDGPKHDWFLQTAPTAVPLGSTIPESGLSLACREWQGDRHEGEDAFAERVRHHLGTCRTVFLEKLGAAPNVFCWPENVACETGRTIARELGYLATTAGAHRNTRSDPYDRISRIHAGGNVLGFFCPTADALYLRAQLRLVQGRFYWYAPIAVMNGIKQLIRLSGLGTGPKRT